MALLIVQSQTEDGLAAPGNRDRCAVCVSVTDSAGLPVSGLTAANFKVDALIVGPGGGLVSILNARFVLPGAYIVDVVPIGTQTWKAGIYIFAVTVTRGVDQGQTLSKVKLD